MNSPVSKKVQQCGKAPKAPYRKTTDAERARQYCIFGDVVVGAASQFLAGKFISPQCNAARAAKVRPPRWNAIGPERLGLSLGPNMFPTMFQ
jgi:hypothetical protein